MIGFIIGFSLALGTGNILFLERQRRYEQTLEALKREAETPLSLRRAPFPWTDECEAYHQEALASAARVKDPNLRERMRLAAELEKIDHIKGMNISEILRREIERDIFR